MNDEDEDEYNPETGTKRYRRFETLCGQLLKEFGRLNQEYLPLLSERMEMEHRLTRVREVAAIDAADTMDQLKAKLERVQQLAVLCCEM
jgi:hypothetical protein